MADLWVVGPIAWNTVLQVPCLPSSGGFVQASSATERPGGSGANVAIALASTGASVHMVGYVGDDEPGARLRGLLRAANADVHDVLTREGQTSEVILLIEPSGERTIIGFRPDLLHTVPIPVADVSAGDVAYFAAWHDEFLPAMTELANGGTTVATVPPPRPMPDLSAHYVIGSEDQYGDQDPARFEFASDRILRAVVVTRGAAGVAIYDRHGKSTYPAQRVAAVDSTGAGDAFAAGFLREVAAGRTPVDALAVGIAWASLAVQSPTSIPPPWHDVRGSLCRCGRSVRIRPGEFVPGPGRAWPDQHGRGASSMATLIAVVAALGAACCFALAS
jgi:sugar/nucleoside kinase (ribokinase family)